MPSTFPFLHGIEVNVPSQICSERVGDCLQIKRVTFAGEVPDVGGQSEIEDSSGRTQLALPATADRDGESDFCYNLQKLISPKMNVPLKNSSGLLSLWKSSPPRNGGRGREFWAEWRTDTTKFAKGHVTPILRNNRSISIAFTTIHTLSLSSLLLSRSNLANAQH